jgi:prepilin-type N-terminal cleavage/methylation domain-containing protein
LRRLGMDKRGVTLVEMLIVVAIIGILAMIAIPAYIGQQKSAARTEAYSNLQNLRLLEEQYFADRGCYYQEGATPACTNKTITYEGTYADPSDSGVEDFLPGFKPGTTASLGYAYTITTDSAGAGGGTASCFTATATGKTGTRVSGDMFTIDCNNTRNF